MISIKDLTRDLAVARMPELLNLEHWWHEIESHEKPWDAQRMLEDSWSKRKWEMSFFAEDGIYIPGYVLGSMCTYPGHENKAQIRKIVVDGRQEYRGRGIGRQLVLAFLQKADELGMERTRFRVRVDNPAFTFYEKLGIRRENEIDRTRPDGVASYIYDDNILELIQKFGGYKS